MNIALDGRVINDHFPGIGRYLFNLTDALATLAPEDLFIVLHQPDQPNSRYDLERLTRHDNVMLQPVDVTAFSLAQQWRLPQRLHVLAPDVYYAPYYIYPYRLPYPTVVTLFDVISHTHPQYLPSRRARLIFEVTTRLALRSAQRVLVPSRATAEVVRRYYRVPADKVVVTPLAADTQFRPANAEVVGQVRSRYDLPQRYVLYLGSNKPHKNLLWLVEAWARVLRRRRKEEAVLVIAGHSDPRYPQAQAHATALGVDKSVRFLGSVPEEDLPPLYSGAICFAFPSLAEGFGLPVLEAMACGTPVLCSNLSSLPEVAGDAALQVNPYDVEAITGGLLRLLTDGGLRAELRQKGLAWAAQFTWEHTARATLAAYREVSG